MPVRDHFWNPSFVVLKLKKRKNNKNILRVYCIIFVDSIVMFEIKKKPNKYIRMVRDPFPNPSFYG